jgi:hypothetical protein
MATANAHTGTSITVFLPEGDPDGVRLIFKSHWTGIAVASPRSRYPEVRLAREELRKPGVYVLVGAAEDASYEARIYVGEGEDPRARIDSHHASKDFWNRLVVFTSFGQALNKATIRYLEARLPDGRARRGDETFRSLWRMQQGVPEHGDQDMIATYLTSAPRLTA